MSMLKIVNNLSKNLLTSKNKAKKNEMVSKSVFDEIIKNLSKSKISKNC